jgi:gliding motility-associated-like protein
MKSKLLLFVFSILLLTDFSLFGQNVGLYNQFNGQYDFTFVGNTMNLGENNITDGCEEMTVQTSSADLNLSPNQTIVAAYLYWAGSGSGDYDVHLNSVAIAPQRIFSTISASTGLPYFSAFSDITTQVTATGNGTYTLSDLDISQVLINESLYCERRTNFAGWAIVIVYEDASFPVNQINIYDGLESIPPALNITLNSLNVIDNIGAKIGFVAWEGDNNLAIGETLKLNNAILTNILNPPDNAFNGTNSITGSSTLYNMDLDIYDIQNNIQIGDLTAEIELTSGQDVVLMNVVVTKLNSELPDATIVTNAIAQSCNSRELTIDYTVNNFNCNHLLDAQTPIAFYANNVLVAQEQTQNDILIDGSESGQITLTIPNGIPNDFTLKLVVDDNGTGTGVEAEFIENNNTATTPFSLWVSPQFNVLPNLYSCVSSLTTVAFDFSNYASLVLVNPTDTVRFFNNLTDATFNINAITNTTNYTVNTASTTIYVRLDNAHCNSITSFEINLKIYPSFNTPDDLFTCRINESSSFDFSNYASAIAVNPTDTVRFFETSEDANANIKPITNTSSYLPNTTPKEIFVSVYSGFCYSYTSFTLDYYQLPGFKPLENLTSCNQGLTSGTFDFSSYENAVLANTTDTFTGFYTSLEDAQNDVNEIIIPNNYVAQTTPKEIFVRVENEHCYNTTSFNLTTKNCPPIIYNWVSANNDTKNDTFHIDGLFDIFLRFELEVYNRWGQLVWTGNNNTPEWDGYPNTGFRIDHKNSPSNVYYYILKLNDKDYPEPFIGWIYLSSNK